jgi:hypothetical protein
MGKGIDFAKEGAPIHAAVLEELKEQLLIAMVVKAGGKLDLTVKEVDETGQYLLGFSLEIPDRPTGELKLDARIVGVFHFEAIKKQ